MRCAVPLVLLPFLAGCGGYFQGGSPEGNLNPFNGRYSGDWGTLNETPGLTPDYGGTMQMTVAGDGTISGNFSQTSPTVQTGSLTGRLKRDGTLQFQVAYLDHAQKYEGSVVFDDDRLRGTFGEPHTVYTSSPGFLLHRVIQ